MHWRTRPQCGPPQFAPDYLADPYPILDALRERVPVFYAPALDMWVVTRFAEIDEIFRNPARFSAANAQDPIYPLATEARRILADGFRFTPSMSNCDPPKHTRIRAHNVRAFSADGMALLNRPSANAARARRSCCAHRPPISSRISHSLCRH